jgi:plasmid stability protein
MSKKVFVPAIPPMAAAAFVDEHRPTIASATNSVAQAQQTAVPDAQAAIQSVQVETPPHSPVAGGRTTAKKKQLRAGEYLYKDGSLGIRVSYVLPEPLAVKLRLHAAQHRIDQSAVVAEALTQFFSKQRSKQSVELASEQTTA